MTNLLQKDKFQSNEGADSLFEQLKRTLSTTPVLAMPSFSKEFVVETDASNIGIRAILLQDNKPIAYMSKALGPRTMRLSTYKELLAILVVVDK